MRFVVFCIIAAVSNLVTAQEEAVGLRQTVDELQALVEKLQAENAELSQENAALRSENTRLTDRPAKTLVVDPQEILRLIADEQLKALRLELEKLDYLQARLESEHTLAASTVASHSMLNRLAEARIENRLSLLETQATVQVLQDRRGEIGDVKDPAVLAQIEKAKLLYEQRRAEMDLMRARAKRLTDIDEREAAIGEAKIADLRLREAELTIRETESLLNESRRQVDDQIAEAAIQLAVSHAMEQALQQEAAKLKEFANAASRFEQIQHQKTALQQRLLELEREVLDHQAVRRAKQLHSARLENDVLLPLQIKEKLMMEKFGADHPNVVMIRKEIELFRQQIEALRQSEKLPKQR